MADGGVRYMELLDKIHAIDPDYKMRDPEGEAPEFITVELCKKMIAVGAQRISIPLDAGSDEKLADMGKNMRLQDYYNAVDNAFVAGFRRDQILSSVIIGTPGQTEKDVEDIAEVAHRAGVRISIQKYSPVPGSRWYEEMPEFHGMEMELLDGNLYPAVKDRKTLDELLNKSRLISDDVSAGVNDKRKEYFSFKESKRKEQEMDKDLVTKLVNVIIDISAQNEQIIRGIEDVKKAQTSLEERIGKIEKNGN
jgi:radical SAM superfamily enzyme YgiQ (UPF0313 family)